LIGMSVTRVGATKKFSDNWDNIFGNGRSASKKQSAVPALKAAKKKPAKKKTPSKAIKKGKARG
jgi:hypothetical protein